MKLVLALVVGCSGATLAAAQQPVDRIVAIVGTRPILASQVEEEYVQAQAQGQPIPPDSAGRVAMRRDILDHLVELELLVQQAQRDTTIKITEQEVLDQVEQTYQNVRKQFPTEAEFRDQIKQARFGSVEEWRRWLGDEQRRQLYAQRLIEAQKQKGKLKPIPPTEAQMREFWEQNKGQQARRPATVGFRQIMIRPEPDSASKRRAYQLAESLVVALRHGADFAAAAKRFSGDSASAAQGGELGWFRRGVMVKQFEDWAFHLKPGEISEPVETPFGFHIIEIERTQPAEVLGRHILIMPDISAEQIAKARTLADSVHDALAQGGASFDVLAKAHGDPQEPKLAEDVPFDKLPPEYQQTMAGDTTLGLKHVFTLGADMARPKFVVLDVTSRHPEGELGFEDVKMNIRQTLGDQLAIKHFIDQLKRQTYIDIRL
jgi:peptidyl-prolyl cis-trans isomerase SurA